MLPRNVWLWSLAISFPLACQPSADESASRDELPREDPRPARVPSARLQPLFTFAQSFGKSQTEIRGELGAPLDTQTLDTANVFTTGEERFLTLIYPGLQFVLYSVGRDEPGMLDAVVLTDSLPIPGSAIRVAQTTQAKLIDALGTPYRIETRNDSTVLHYQYIGEEWGPEEDVFFVFAGGVLRRIVWHFYIG